MSAAIGVDIRGVFSSLDIFSRVYLLGLLMALFWSASMLLRLELRRKEACTTPLQTGFSPILLQEFSCYSNCCAGGCLQLRRAISELRRLAEVAAWGEHAARQQLLAAAAVNLLGPGHPVRLAEAEKVARPVIRHKPEVIQTEQNEA
jgi:hypothetical protein